MNAQKDMLVSRGAGLIEAELDGEIMGLHVENGQFYRFNPTAVRVWRLIEEPRMLSAICATLAAEFKVEPDRCEADVRALLDNLATDGLVKLA